MSQLNDQLRELMAYAPKEFREAPRVLTAGYSGRDPHRLRRIAEAMDATVVDIRLQPRSRAPQWQKRSMIGLLGHRYTLCSKLGNVNYNTGGPIMIRDMDFGLVYLLEGLIYCPRLILLCGCREPEGCHRTVVARELTERHGIVTAELDWETSA